LQFLAHHGPILTPLETGEPLQPLNRDWAPGRAVLDRTTVQIEDLLGEGDTEFPLTKKLQRSLGFRTVLATPLLREGVPIGVIAIRRREAQPFSHKQIELLKTFADQAVIAIENVRLFKELQERTEALTKSVNQLTALGEVGQAISSTLDLETVLKTIVLRAVQLTGLDAGAIYEYDAATEQFHLVAAENMPEVMVEVLRSKPIRKGEGAVGGTAVAREPIQVPDTQDESYKGRLRDLVIRTGRRALLAVPLMHEEHIVGALAVHRNTPGPFAPEVVDLLKTFATQSALAIQNARLFREIAEKGKQLEVASHHKSQFLASMSHELRTPLNAILGFNEMMLDGLCGEVPAGFKDPLDETQKSGKHLLRLINNVLDLAKIEAGRMELALADYSVHDTVESVRSTLRPLAAEKGLEFLANVPADIPLAYGDAGRITQCLMNLAGNSLKFTKEGRVEISVQQQNGQLRYCVADTGIGIPPESIGSLFTEFKQTDATIASEYGGTGLGLSITKKFIEMHGGRIWVESEIGKGSAFIFEIPLKLGK
jgi:signal transduction histidine kinase